MLPYRFGALGGNAFPSLDISFINQTVKIMAYTVKYEDYYGDVHTKRVSGYDERDAIKYLSPAAKIIYWVKPIKK